MTRSAVGRVALAAIAALAVCAVLITCAAVDGGPAVTDAARVVASGVHPTHAPRREQAPAASRRAVVLRSRGELGTASASTVPTRSSLPTLRYGVMAAAPSNGGWLLDNLRTGLTPRAPPSLPES
jgi:hypothetical protein